MFYCMPTYENVFLNIYKRYIYLLSMYIKTQKTYIFIHVYV